AAPTAPPAALRTPEVRPSTSDRPRDRTPSRSFITSLVCLRPRSSRAVASACASAVVIRPRSTASPRASSMRSRVSMTISSGPIRFLRSASRNSATVLASTPALRAGREAVRAVVLAALRAFCWRPRACPPFLAAAVRLADEGFLADEDLADEDLALDDFALEERLLADEDR